MNIAGMPLKVRLVASVRFPRIMTAHLAGGGQCFYERPQRLTQTETMLSALTPPSPVVP